MESLGCPCRTSDRPTSYPLSVGGGAPAGSSPLSHGDHLGQTGAACDVQPRTCAIGTHPSSRRPCERFVGADGLQLRDCPIGVRSGKDHDGQSRRVGRGIAPIDRPHGRRHPHGCGNRALGDRRGSGSLFRRRAPAGWLGVIVSIGRTDTRPCVGEVPAGGRGGSFEDVGRRVAGRRRRHDLRPVELSPKPEISFGARWMRRFPPFDRRTRCSGPCPHSRVWIMCAVISWRRRIPRNSADRRVVQLLGDTQDRSRSALPPTLPLHPRAAQP